MEHDKSHAEFIWNHTLCEGLPQLSAVADEYVPVWDPQQLRQTTRQRQISSLSALHHLEQIADINQGCSTPLSVNYSHKQGKLVILSLYLAILFGLLGAALVMSPAGKPRLLRVKGTC